MGLCNGTGSVRLPVLHTAPFFRRTPLLLVCCCVPGEQEIWIDSGRPAATAPPQHGARTAANAGSATFAAAVGSSGLTRNSGASGQISKSSPPSPYPTLPPLTVPLSHPSLPFTSFSPLPFTSPSLFPTLSFPFSVSLPVITARGSGEHYSSPWGPGEARPPNAFLCNSQSKICKSVKSFTHVHQTPIHSLSWECCNKTLCSLISRSLRTSLLRRW